MNVKLCDESGDIIEEENIKDLSFKFTDSKLKDTDNIVTRKKYLGNGIHKVSYLILQPGEYNISVLVSEDHVEGSPFFISF